MKEHLERMDDFLERVKYFWPKDEENKFINPPELFILFHKNQEYAEPNEKGIPTVLKLANYLLLSSYAADRSMDYTAVIKSAKIKLEPEPNAQEEYKKYGEELELLQGKIIEDLKTKFPEARLILGRVE